MNNNRSPLLQVHELSIGIKGSEPLVQRISFSLRKGGVLGVAGESGSGKTLTAMAVAGLLSLPLKLLGGGVAFNGRPLLKKNGRLNGCRHGRDVMMIFQSPYAALDPTSTAGKQILSAIKSDKRPKAHASREHVLSLMEMVGLSRDLYSYYPFQLSGGQRQRVILAMAFGIKPRILIADEPTSGQDERNGRQILNLFRRLQYKAGTSIILISHDLRVIGQLADQMIVLHKGMLVESGKTEDILIRPEHPHSVRLVEALRFLTRGEVI